MFQTMIPSEAALPPSHGLLFERIRTDSHEKVSIWEASLNEEGTLKTATIETAVQEEAPLEL